MPSEKPSVGEDLQRRTFDFALRIVRVVRAIPKTVEGRAIGGQLVRCGTSVGANYRACCKARSRAEFISKIGIVEEETNESVYWLDLIIAANVLPSQRVEPLLKEARELEKIFAQSRITATRNRTQTP
ncbi:MAG: four helix bundle protein [Tepidisphaeraceae bacterium]